jgi:hypothetical protein
MIKNLTAPKLSLKAIEKTLGSAQKLSTALQSNLKGGTSGGEDLRRPPRIEGTVEVTVII